MSGSGATAWPGIEVQQWPGQEQQAAPKGQGEHGYAPAPPEEKPPPTIGDATAAQPGEATAPAWMSQRKLVDTSITPGPNVADTVPLSRDPATGNLQLALPNPVRAILTEGPQFDQQGKLTVPASTINPATGSLGVTPEAAAGAALLSPTGLLFGAPKFVPPGTLNPRAPLSPEFKANPLAPGLSVNDVTPSGPATATGIVPPRNPLAPAEQPAPPPQAAQPAPQAAAPASTAPMTADEILARSKGYYSPADQQAAQGATINPTQSNAIRGVITDTLPTDPQKAAVVGSTPLTQMAKDLAPFDGQPMSFDTVMALDRRLTQEKQAASATRGGADMARQIGDVQDQVRDKMQSLGPDDTTGDPTALANLANARAAYSQYIKEDQLNDIRYNAGLLPVEKQDASVRSQVTSLLKSPRSAKWTPDERAALEASIQTGLKGPVTNFAVGLIKPAMTAAGAHVLGPAGALVGSAAGDVAQSSVREMLARRRPDRLGPVSSQITAGVPPPAPPSQTTGPARSQWAPWTPNNALGPGSVDPSVMSDLQDALAKSRARQAQWQQQPPPSP